MPFSISDHARKPSVSMPWLPLTSRSICPTSVVDDVAEGAPGGLAVSTTGISLPHMAPMVNSRCVHKSRARRLNCAG